MKKQKQAIQAIKDFTEIRNTTGDLEAIHSEYILSHEELFKSCIQNKEIIYGLAWTQSGKTMFKLVLAKWALDKGIVDNVIISTTNLTTAKKQLMQRTRDYFRQFGCEVKSTDDVDPIMLKGNVFVNMTSAHRTNQISHIIEEAEDQARKIAKRTCRAIQYPRILIIFDEGEEFHGGMGDANENFTNASCDRELFNLIHTRDGVKNSSISIAKVSATLLSHLMIHGQFTRHQGHLTSKQVFQLPVSPTYKGIPGGMSFDTNLVEESRNVFAGDSYKNIATLKTTENFVRVTESIDRLIREDRHGLPQIGNVVMGVNRAGHSIISNLLSQSFIKMGYTTEIWDTGSFDMLNKNSEIIMLIQNGDTDSTGTIVTKLQQIANNWHTTPKAILIIAKKMTSKSITIELEDSTTLRHPHFGYYANFTIWYGPKNADTTMEIQSMRCTGNRPPLKQHVMITTEYTANAIQNYYKQEEEFIHQLRVDGTLDTSTALTWFIAPHKKIAKASVNRLIGATNGQKNFRGTKVSISQMFKMQADGITQLDGVYEIPKRMYNTLIKKTDEDLRNTVFEYIKSKGFVALGAATRVRRAKDYYPNRDSAILAYTVGDKLNGEDSLVAMHLFERDGRAGVYAINVVKSELRPDEHLLIDITFDDTIIPEFLQGKLMSRGNKTVYKVRD